MGWFNYLYHTLFLLTALPFVRSIYQGTNSNCGEHPYAVQIFHTAESGGGAYLCGGTLITPKHVLTACHCAALTPNVPTGKAAPSDLKVSLLRCNSDRKLDREGGKSFDVISTSVNEKWLQDGYVDGDIAVLELAEPVKFHPFLSDPAALPAYEGPIQATWEGNTLLTLIGAGTFGTSQTDISEWLRQVRAEVITKEECGMRVDATFGVPYSSSHLNKGQYFCAIDRITLGGACGGDSGSGSVEYVNGRKRTVGVVAAGAAVCANPNHVNIYGSVSAWMPWIKDAVGTSYTLKQI